MFGRRFTRKGWLKLGMLAGLCLLVAFILTMPLLTVSVKLDLPPATAKPEPITGSDIALMLAWLVGLILFFCLLVVLPIWLLIRAVRKIVDEQPRLDR